MACIDEIGRSLLPNGLFKDLLLDNTNDKQNKNTRGQNKQQKSATIFKDNICV